MIYTKEQYVNLHKIQMPLKLESGLTITSLSGSCSECGKYLVDLRGEVIEHNNCSEVRYAGLCHPCKLLVTCQFRYYKDGRVMQNSKLGWYYMTRVESYFSRITRFFKELLFIRRKL